MRLKSMELFEDMTSKYLFSFYDFHSDKYLLRMSWKQLYSRLMISAINLKPLLVLLEIY